jgi:hypothetical protein
MNFIRVEDGVVNIKRVSKEIMGQTKYMRDLLQSQVDSYYIVLVTINEIMESGNIA